MNKKQQKEQVKVEKEVQNRIKFYKRQKRTFSSIEGIGEKEELGAGKYADPVQD